MFLKEFGLKSKLRKSLLSVLITCKLKSLEGFVNAVSQIPYKISCFYVNMKVSKHFFKLNKIFV